MLLQYNRFISGRHECIVISPNQLLIIKNYFLCAWRTPLHGLDSLAIVLSFHTDYCFFYSSV